MTRELFLKYAELKVQAQQIDQELKDLQPRLLTELAEVGDKPVELSGIGTFAVVHRKEWTYSPAVVEVAATLKEMKKEEEANGAALFEEARGVLFKRLT